MTAFLSERAVERAERTPPSAWRQRSYQAFLLAQFINLLGTQLSFVALPWFVLSTTGSPSMMSIVLIAEVLPMALVGIPAGALLDRFNIKRFMVGLDLAHGAAALLIPTLAVLGLLEFWHIVVLAFVGGALAAPYLGARMALVPALVGSDETDLTRANSALGLSLQTTTILGPVLAGVLIGAIGNTNVLFLDAASFFLTAALLGCGVRYRPVATDAASRSTWLQDLGIGLRFLAGTPVVRTIILTGMLAVLGFSVLIQAVLPVFVRDVLQHGPNELGLLVGTWGVGSVAGMSLHGVLAERWPWRRGETLRNLSFGMALPVWLLTLFPSLGTAIAGLLLTALFTGPIVVSIQTMMQTETPPELRGRVFSAMNALWMIATPIGLAVAGPLLETSGAIAGLILVGTVLLASLATAWLSPTIRHA